MAGEPPLRRADMDVVPSQARVQIVETPQPVARAQSLTAAWWRALVALGVLLAIVFYTYRETVAGMVEIWSRSATFAHAFAVLPITLWLIWRKRAEVAAHPPRTAPWMLALLPLVGAMWLLGDLARVNAATQFTFVSFLIVLVVLLIGWRAARPIGFALGFLFFGVPFGEFLIPQFMLWTADFTALALRITGVPVYREGLQLLIPTGTWSIVEACSGIRYLIASLMVGTLYAYLCFRSLKLRLLFVGVALLMPIVANWVRAYLIVMLGHVSSNQLAVGADHLIYGWLFFGVVILLMLFIGNLLSDLEPLAPEAGEATMPQAPTSRAGLTTTAVLAALLVVTPAFTSQALPGSAPLGEFAPPLLNAGGDWRADGAAEAQWRPDFTAPMQWDVVYANPKGEQVGVFLGYFPRQDAHRKLVSNANELVSSDNPTWWAVDTALATTGLQAGLPPEVLQVFLRGSKRPTSVSAPRLVAWRLYRVNDRWIARDDLAKLHQLWQRLRGRGDDGAILVIHGTSVELLQAFMRDNLRLLQSHLDRLREPAASRASSEFKGGTS